ncbi:von Willebrand factor D and EGF domain-containing protein-like isoform X1 [Branchiostoma floridae x Branchiostoma belcheri]
MLKAQVLLLGALVALLTNHEALSWRRRRSCVWHWNSWSACSAPCGPSGTQTRTASGCGAPGPQTRTCNRFCHNGGTLLTSSCRCPLGFRGTCCETLCNWHWNSWSACSAPCGPSGTQTRTASGCGAPGPQTQPCNRFCHNGGTLLTSSCWCPLGFRGTCCDTPVALGDPCTDYVALDEPSRSAGVEATPGGPFRCDSGLRTQWYRFVSPAGGEIPTDCSLLAPSSCSTTGPVWMKGSLPAISEGNVTRQACRRSLSSGDCEANCWDIRVRQCDGPPEPYYVYQLPPTPGCDEAYCAGTNVQCPTGQSSENYGFTPGCSASFPKITTSPKLTNGTEPYQVVLFCDFDRPQWDNLTMEVFWVADNTLIFEDTLINGESRSILTQDDLKAGMGKTIVCKVRGRYKGGGAPGTMEISNEFFAGVKILTQDILIEEGGEAKNIQLQPTLPLVCTKFATDFGVACQLSVQIVYKTDDSADNICEGSLPYEAVQQTCSLDFNEATWNGIIEFPVRAVSDSIADGSRRMKIGFNPFSTDPAPLWDKYQIGDIFVTTRDNDPDGDVVCKSTGDPHYTTFDGKYYHVYQPGTFTLMQHRFLPIEVQTRTKMCNAAGNVACNCGVAIRAGNEVFIITKCKDGVNKFSYSTGKWVQFESSLATKVEHHGPVGIDTRFYYKDGGHRFLVYFPTGSWMDIIAIGSSNQYLNIYFYPSADDYNKTLGLCGTFDGDSTNDGLYADLGTELTIGDNQVITGSAFVTSWKLPDDDNLFVGSLKPSFLPLDERRYCECNIEGSYQEVRCDSSYAYNCQWNSASAGASPVAEQQNARKRRSTSYHDEVYDDDMFGFDYNEPAIPVAPPTWPAPNGMTEAEARTFCEDAMTGSPAGQLCTSVLGDKVDLSSATESCVADIQATGDTTWAETAVATMESSCGSLLYRNTSFWTSNSTQTNNGTLIPPSFFYETVSCPDNCSQNGICEKGECICQVGFEGPSCSIESATPPDVFFIPKEGLCDINTRPCERTPVIGKNFLESANLTCSLQAATIDNNGVHPLNDKTTVAATFENFARVVCPLPRSRVRRSTAAGHRTPAEATLVSISNDGVRFSPPVLLITYDAVCQDCNATGFCVLRNNSCEIDGTCYSSGDTQIGNWCKQCVPSVNVSAWSDSLDNSPPVFEPTGDIIAFINHQLEFTVKAADPENSPQLSYSLVGASPDPDLSLSSDGQLNWTPKLNTTIIVNVAAADQCGATSTESLTVIARDCPCQNGGMCPSFALDSPDNINCSCNGTGFTGQMCDVDVDECADSPCVHGVCNNTVGGFQCDCEQYYTGPLCDQETPCFSNPCPDNGTCADIPGAIQCTICPEGSACVVIEIPLDPCSPNPCYANVTCDVVDDVYSCGPCPAGMTGDGVSCVQVIGCSSQPCYPEVTCTDVPGGHECGDCPQGMTGDGKNCTQDTGVADQQGSSWYEQPAYIALLSVGAVVAAAALIGVAVWRVKARGVTRAKVGDLPLEDRDG